MLLHRHVRFHRSTHAAKSKSRRTPSTRPRDGKQAQ
jgi:hypothetical protein